ncbi:MAG: formamidopyrimidine-DNA glycosylase, partial [Planctomycetes bacterium]|nr:formamidopyrimidine-DNA glycosylase [Planctomycetota bacterium]
IWFWDRRGLGTVSLLNPQQMSRLFGQDRLGPDALEMRYEDWEQRLRKTRRSIKVALLDQKLVAGIGNLYASEILHVSGISPCRPANVLTKRQMSRLAEAVRSVLQTAIELEGSTLGDGTYRNALNQSGQYQNRHLVYMKEGDRCSTCDKGHIERIVQTQRSTFYCPHCQK